MSEIRKKQNLICRLQEKCMQIQRYSMEFVLCFQLIPEEQWAAIMAPGEQAGGFTS